MFNFLYHGYLVVRGDSPTAFMVFFVYVWVLWAGKSLLARRYRPAFGDPGHLPATVIVPVFSESEALFRRVLDSVRANRPAESEEATVQLGRPPSSDELAIRSDLSVEEVREARLAVTAYTALSLDARAAEQSTLPSVVQAEEDPRYLLVEDIALLGSALRILPPRERRILALHFGAELSQAEIGERLGISQMHVSRLMRRSLDRVTRVAEKRLAPLREAA